MTKLPADVKAKWIEALRSGKYTQDRDTLRSKNNKFCCLGVLCDILAPSSWMDNGDDRPNYMHQGNYGYPNLSFLESHDVNLTYDEVHEIADLNDVKELNFEQIADYIEENL